MEIALIFWADVYHHIYPSKMLYLSPLALVRFQNWRKTVLGESFIVVSCAFGASHDQGIPGQLENVVDGLLLGARHFLARGTAALRHQREYGRLPAGGSLL